MYLKRSQFNQRDGFVLAETMVALLLLSAGVSLGLGTETMMAQHERAQVRRIKQARKAYEQARLSQFNLRPLSTDV